MTQTVVVRLDGDIVERLTNLAQMTGRTKTYYIKEAVKEKIDEMELIYLAKSRAEDIKAGRGTTISLEELKSKYEL